MHLQVLDFEQSHHIRSRPRASWFSGRCESIA
jgi:hypothetical protein